MGSLLGERDGQVIASVANVVQTRRTARPELRILFGCLVKLAINHARTTPSIPEPS